MSNGKFESGSSTIDRLAKEAGGNILKMSASEIDSIAEQVGKFWGVEKKVTTSQIRNIYGYINIARQNYKMIKTGRTGSDTMESVKDMLIMLKPKLAYSAGRNPDIEKAGVSIFYRGVINSLEKVDVKSLGGALDNFFKLSESIVAYHKYFGKEQERRIQ